jgi:RNA polymerase sigma factor (TIGR02999 family)
MTDVTRILSAIEQGDPQAAQQLLPLIYDELRKLAAHKLARESPGQTLQATALVHEAYLRLVGPQNVQSWDSRGHFFAAAAEAMRRILIDQARRKNSDKHGGQHVRQAYNPELVEAPAGSDDLLDLDEALKKLSLVEPQIAELVKLRYFAGLTIPQVAEVLSVSPRTADSYWAYAKAYLLKELRGDAG